MANTPAMADGKWGGGRVAGIGGSEEGEKGPGGEGIGRYDGMANTPAMPDGKWRGGGVGAGLTGLAGAGRSWNGLAGFAGLCIETQ